MWFLIKLWKHFEPILWKNFWYFFKKAVLFKITEKNHFGDVLFSSHIRGCVGPIFSKNNRVRPCTDPHQPRKFCRNGFKMATHIKSSYWYKGCPISLCVLLIGAPSVCFVGLLPYTIMICRSIRVERMQNQLATWNSQCDMVSFVRACWNWKNFGAKRNLLRHVIQHGFQKPLLAVLQNNALYSKCILPSYWCWPP